MTTAARSAEMAISDPFALPDVTTAMGSGAVVPHPAPRLSKYSGEAEAIAVAKRVMSMCRRASSWGPRKAQGQAMLDVIRWFVESDTAPARAYEVLNPLACTLGVVRKARRRDAANRAAQMDAAVQELSGRPQLEKRLARDVRISPSKLRELRKLKAYGRRISIARKRFWNMKRDKQVIPSSMFNAFDPVPEADAWIKSSTMPMVVARWTAESVRKRSTRWAPSDARFVAYTFVHVAFVADRAPPPAALIALSVALGLLNLKPDK